ncbi:MAG: hypothetical protein Kow0031_18400 [Anaerolineae bacterium]
MGFLDSIKSIFAGEPEQADYWVYARCRRCGEVIKTRIDLRHDLSEADDGGFTVNKTLVGGNLCFERLGVTLIFDRNRNLIDQQIERGEFITAEEY